MQRILLEILNRLDFFSPHLDFSVVLAEFGFYNVVVERSAHQQKVRKFKERLSFICRCGSRVVLCFAGYCILSPVPFVVLPIAARHRIGKASANHRALRLSTAEEKLAFCVAVTPFLV